MRPNHFTSWIIIAFATVSAVCAQPEKTVPGSGEKFEICLSDGTSMLRQRRYSQALDKFDQALAIKPRSAHALSLKARALKFLNRSDDALAAISKAKQYEPKSVQPYLSLASFSLREKNVARAKEYLAQAERLEPHNYEVAGLMSTCLVIEKDYKGALVYANESVRRHPDAYRFAQRAAIYRNLGQRSNELKDYDRAVALDPKNPSFATERATTLFQAGNVQQAMKEVNRAISLDDKFAPAYHIRANVYLVMKQKAAAIADASKAISLEESGHYYHFRGAVFESMRELRRALSDELKAEKLLPDQPAVKVAISRLYHSLLEPKLALKYITEAIKLDPKNSDYYDERSQIYRTMMEYELSVADDSKSIEYAKRPPVNAYINRIRYYRAKKKFDLALKDQNQLISMLPNRVGLKEGRALIYLERAEQTHSRADYQHAKEDLDEVLVALPNETHYSMRAQANLKLGNLKAALADVNQAIVKQPGMSSYYQLRADIHKAMGKTEEMRKDMAAAKVADDAALPPH